MKTIRRLYLYLVSFISLEVVLWGLIGLARSTFSSDRLGSGVSQLASALSLIFVGVPVFLLHWWLAQRNIQNDPEERFARLRAIFLYGSLLALLIPIAQNALALLDRFWLEIFNLPSRMAILGMGQSTVDNLIAIVMNGLLSAYIFSVLRKDWGASPHGDNFPETRRLYRYAWVLYSLTMVVMGVQQILYYILNLAETIGNGNQASLANGLALALIGTPLWVYAWQTIQKSQDQPDEKQSTLRLVILYALSLIGVGGVLIPSGIVLNTILGVIFGDLISFGNFLAEISAPLSAAIPLAGVWAYYGRMLTREVNQLPDTPRRSGLRRFYYYILAFIGLTTTFLGMLTLLSFLTELLIHDTAWGSTLQIQLSGALSSLIIGLPLWVVCWNPMIAEAAQEGENGDHARRSLIRKIYLYLALFAGVIGIMTSAGSLIFQLLSKLLGDPPDNFERATWVLLELLVLFTVLLAYHWSTMRADGRMAERSLSARHEAYPILVLASEIGEYSDAVMNALQQEAPSLPVAVHVVQAGVPDASLADAQAVILPGELAANPPEAIRLWLQGFTGTKIVVPTPSDGWLWTFGSGRSLSNLVRHTAKVVRHLAEGEEIPRPREVSGWMIFLYMLAGLVGIPILISLIGALSNILY